MDRRHFVRFCGTIAATGIAAGCAEPEDAPGADDPVEEATDQTRTGTDAGARATLEPDSAVQVHEVDVITAPNRNPEDVDPVVTPIGSEHVEITATEFERTGANDMYVATTVRNVSERALTGLRVGVDLYDASRLGNELSHSGTRERARPRLDAGQTWTVGISFDGVDIGTIDYYTVTVQANFA